MATEKINKNLSTGRLQRIGSIMYATHDIEQIVVEVLADYAVVGGTPIDALKKRAKKRVEEKRDAAKS